MHIVTAKARIIGARGCVAIVDGTTAVLGMTGLSVGSSDERSSVIALARMAALAGFETDSISNEFGPELAAATRSAGANAGQGLPIIWGDLVLGGIGVRSGNSAHDNLLVAIGRDALVALRTSLTA